MTLLEVRNLSVSIAGIKACRELGLGIAEADRWAVLGRNGIGKTTLLKTLAGLHRQDGGSILLDGKPIETQNRRQLARRIGVLFQEQTTIFPGTVLETALIGRHPHLGSWGWEQHEDIERARCALATVGLGGFEERSIATLSGGERQRLAIATLLAQDPALSLLDEPSNHLDPYHQVHVMETLCRRVRPGTGRAMVVVLHDVNLAVRFCSHALLLYGVGAVEYGPAGEVLTPENLQRLYGHPVIGATTEHGRFYYPA